MHIYYIYTFLFIFRPARPNFSDISGLKLNIIIVTLLSTQRDIHI